MASTFRWLKKTLASFTLAVHHSRGAHMPQMIVTGGRHVPLVTASQSVQLSKSSAWHFALDGAYTRERLQRLGRRAPQCSGGDIIFE